MKLEGQWSLVVRSCNHKKFAAFEIYVAREVEISEGVLTFVDDKTGQSIVTNSRFFLTSIKGAKTE